MEQANEYTQGNLIGIGLVVFIVIIFLTGFQYAYCQRVVRDSLESGQAGLETLPDSMLLHPEYLPPDLMFIPADFLYDHLWDNKSIRLMKVELWKKADTTHLVLRQGDENPFVFPVKGKLISPFGYRGRHHHMGLDIRLQTGDSVLCALDGKVRIAKRFGGYGNMVLVRHNNGLETLYAHLSKIKVTPNQDIKAGDLIGLGGHTGRARGPHLHFETRYLGEPFDPTDFLDMDNFVVMKDTLELTSETFSEFHKPRVVSKKAGSTAKISPKHIANVQVGDSLAAALPLEQTVRDTGPQPGNAALKKTVAQQQASAKTKSPVKKHKPVYHTVRSGDTLGALAVKYHTTVKKICQLNGIRAHKLLKIGTRLKVR